MIDSTATLRSEHLTKVADIVARISTLPAVATTDWCERAAETLQPIRSNAASLVMLVEFESDGQVGRREAIGMVRGGGDGVGEAELDRLHPESATDLGWVLPIDNNPAKPRAAALRKAQGNERFPMTPAGRRWAQFGVGDLLVGVIALDEKNPNRALVVEMGLPGENGFDQSDAAVLAAVLPILVQRARLAFGREASDPTGRLTPREQQILEYLALGKTVKQIATDLSRSPHTIHDHVKSLHRKLNASSRGELIARALGHIEACGQKNTQGGNGNGRAHGNGHGHMRASA